MDVGDGDGGGGGIEEGAVEAGGGEEGAFGGGVAAVVGVEGVAEGGVLGADGLPGGADGDEEGLVAVGGGAVGFAEGLLHGEVCGEARGVLGVAVAAAPGFVVNGAGLGRSDGGVEGCGAFEEGVGVEGGGLALVLKDDEIPSAGGDAFEDFGGVEVLLEGATAGGDEFELGVLVGRGGDEAGDGLADLSGVAVADEEDFFGRGRGVGGGEGEEEEEEDAHWGRMGMRERGGEGEVGGGWGRLAFAGRARGLSGGRRGLLAAFEEDVGLDLGVDFGVAADDVGEGLVVDQVDEFAGEMGFVVEAIAIAEADELLAQDAVEHGADHGAGEVGFTEAADPAVDEIEGAVDLLHGLPDGGVGIDVAEFARGALAEGLADFGVAGQAVITAALHVEGGEIESAGAGRAEEEVADVIDDVAVEFLAGLTGEAAEEGVDAFLLDVGGIEEGVGEGEVAGGGFRSVRVETQEGGGEEAVAEAVGGSREEV